MSNWLLIISHYWGKYKFKWFIKYYFNNNFKIIVALVIKSD